jgi:hypothetical protein
MLCECGYHFKPKSKPDNGAPAPEKSGKRKYTRRKPKEVPDQPPSLVEMMGLIEDLKAMTAELGGPDKALSMVERVAAMVKRTGGVESLKASLQAVCPAPVAPATEVKPVVENKTEEPKVEKVKAHKVPKAKPLTGKADDGDKPMPGESPVVPAA